ncbi:hypothetical protein AUK57_00370 [Candidatus Saccharibacteria bacterium CG2_30_41_52]|nr:hypothetical protein [Candidatus Saccharibacteria bacterium]OIP86217.1 MAG: hypothetical protein AUK57_00370 [Candidatus Saccharibacteria bacterium CG2_30_41_52]PJE66068.1 MAG: hypothetical protein COU92_02585 [Candidatus Saccharibacteria bacterium CG10_big_fil_rev_8_21_14_0_10_41_32]
MCVCIKAIFQETYSTAEARAGFLKLSGVYRKSRYATAKIKIIAKALPGIHDIKSTAKNIKKMIKATAAR